MSTLTTGSSVVNHLDAEPDPFDPHTLDDDAEDEPYEESPDPT